MLICRKDSTGIPHILEHSVLCGSRKYPLKEPFVELLKGSLHTFLNAFTYPDRTCYPVASTNTKVQWVKYITTSFVVFKELSFFFFFFIYVWSYVSSLCIVGFLQSCGCIFGCCLLPQVCGWRSHFSARGMALWA